MVSFAVNAIRMCLKAHNINNINLHNLYLSCMVRILLQVTDLQLLMAIETSNTYTYQDKEILVNDNVIGESSSGKEGPWRGEERRRVAGGARLWRRGEGRRLLLVNQL